MTATKTRGPRERRRPSRLDQHRPRAAAYRTNGSAPGAVQSQVDWALFLKTAAVSCGLGAGTIHGVWVVLHFGEWLAAGVFFAGLALAQVGGVFAMVAAPGRRTYLAVAASNLGPILVWVVSRTAGMPMGPGAGEPAPVGMADLAATSFELVTVCAVVPLLLRWTPAKPRRATAGGMPRRGYAALVAIPLYALALTFAVVVPAAAGHGGDGHAGQAQHNHATHSHG